MIESKQSKNKFSRDLTSTNLKKKTYNIMRGSLTNLRGAQVLHRGRVPILERA